ncbi:MAG TPA: alpha-hydroxy acid oxidase [Acidimicrobiales bacterium]|nr:alpha-hydroxy acid oxidase [Acidimicrobiales bacterium]
MGTAGRIHSVDDARRRAARSLPRPLFDYVDGGAEDEVTLRANRSAFDRVTFRPRMGSGLAAATTATTVLGTPLSLPVVLAPAGLVRFVHPDGAQGAARGAARGGTLSVLSTVAGTALEEVADAVDGPRWFQLYSHGGPDHSAELVDRAGDAGYGALVVTLDTSALGNRERDVRHGVTQPLQLSVAGAARLAGHVAARPRWLVGTARALARSRAGGSGPRPGSRGPHAPRAAVLTRPAPGGAGGRVVMERSPFSWEDVAAIRRRWSGPLLVKGVLTGADAARAVEVGVDGVVVSNHGGRQLDGAPATLRVLPAVVEAVGGRAAVLLDGGVRRGSDVVKALALGAQAVMVGRAFLYGLAAGGEDGVARVIEILRSELERTLVLLGCPSVQDLDPSWIDLPGAAPG